MSREREVRMEVKSDICYIADLKMERWGMNQGMWEASSKLEKARKQIFLYSLPKGM